MLDLIPDTNDGNLFTDERKTYKWAAKVMRSLSPKYDFLRENFAGMVMRNEILSMDKKVDETPIEKGFFKALEDQITEQQKRQQLLSERLEKQRVAAEKEKENTEAKRLAVGKDGGRSGVDEVALGKLDDALFGSDDGVENASEFDLGGEDGAPPEVPAPDEGSEVSDPSSSDESDDEIPLSKLQQGGDGESAGADKVSKKNKKKNKKKRKKKSKKDTKKKSGRPKLGPGEATVAQVANSSVLSAEEEADL